MTLMTLNPGYGIGISSKQRHERHLRHYRHRKKCAGGLGYTSSRCGYPNAMLAKHVYPQNGDNQTGYRINSYMLQSESVLIRQKS